MILRPALLAIALMMLSVLINASTMANRAFAAAESPSIAIAHNDDVPGQEGG
jgi:hypothetical protein